ncbi:uncharacterized protein PV06_04196 [Exophiala oligosperma]|uniref:BD-FAE-like domain-containing protein n=1 Tax=Exophiala oligosperma TaxID=215243 RepID=A0A0D2DJB2_9EURO|nr:uncharacterized protein PV06_04196 [Exophiala oligosperma]KIW43048.1 hypothetical protein PV06_04196 [Exophiala oligosperma]
MDSVFDKIAESTVTFNLGDEETWRELYEPFYSPPPASVKVVKDRQYGSHERHRLDVYVPSSQQGGKPVLLFVHGGGFFSGDKGWSDKCWANIGYFFANAGIVVVIANHRLVPHVQHPGGAEDIQMVREWIYHNINSPDYGHGDPNKTVLFGHSSGGAHIATNLFLTSKTRVFPPVAGVMFFSVPWWFDTVTRPIRKRVITQYYGSDNEEVWGPQSPLGLFRQLPADSPFLDSDKVPVYVGTVKWEVKEAVDSNMVFFDAYRAKSKPAGTLPLLNVLDKHNHLSNVLSIGTEDTSQSSLILDFVDSCVRNVEKRGGDAASKPSL